MRQNLQTFEELGEGFLDCVCKRFESLINKSISESFHNKGEHSVLEKETYVMLSLDGLYKLLIWEIKYIDRRYAVYTE